MRCIWPLLWISVVLTIVSVTAVAQTQDCDPLTDVHCTRPPAQQKASPAIAGPDVSLAHPSSPLIAMTIPAAGPYTPLTSQQKFHIFTHHTVAPVTFLSAGWDALIGQGTGSHPDYGQGMEGFGKRYGASLASSESGVFFAEFLLPTMLHQDPRYFRRGTGTIWNRLVYAGTRVFVTRKDDGRWGFNTSHVLGVGMSVALSNTYIPESEQSADRNLIRIGNILLSDAGFNALREFWPDILRKLRKNKRLGKIAGEVHP